MIRQLLKPDFGEICLDNEVEFENYYTLFLS